MNYTSAIALVIMTLITGITIDIYLKQQTAQVCLQHHTPQECQI